MALAVPRVGAAVVEDEDGFYEAVVRKKWRFDCRRTARTRLINFQLRSVENSSDHGGGSLPDLL